tara:strand:- start:30378 stop:30752 length:375 start_codon:yes stop_codon:yes gene_type:complete
MKTELDKVQNDITALPQLHEFLYEKIFKMYKEGDHYAFNILKKIKIPRDLPEGAVTYVNVRGNMTWPQISYLEYGTINLWWLICISSGITNPVHNPEPGTILRIISPTVVRSVLDEIDRQVKNQ